MCIDVLHIFFRQDMHIGLNQRFRSSYNCLIEARLASFSPCDSCLPSSLSQRQTLLRFSPLPTHIGA